MADEPEPDALRLVEGLLQELGEAEGGDPEDAARLAKVLQDVARLREERRALESLADGGAVGPAQPAAVHASSEELLERLERSLEALEDAHKHADEAVLELIAERTTAAAEPRDERSRRGQPPRRQSKSRAMATALAAQLDQLAAGREEHVRSRVSLLYDLQQAADVDLHTIYAGAASGFAELCRMDGRFEAFSKSLFSKAGAELNRETQDDETNARLDAGIAAYLRLLSAHFVLPAAARTLEFLIRRYKVHVYNVEAAVLCALPFHTTAQFVRWLQVLQLEGTRWAFLSGVKASGAAPTREALTLAVSRNEALLAVLCDAALASATTSAKGISGVGASFYALLCSEAMGCMAQVPPCVMPPVLAYVQAGFGSGASAEHRAGALLLSSQLAGRAQLSAAVVEALLEGIAKVAQPPLEAHALRAMLQVMRTHAVATLPRRAVTFLVKTPALSAVVGQLSRTVEANALVGPLLAGVVAQLGQHHTYVNALCALLADVSVQSHASAVTRQLLRAASAGEPEEMNADVRPRIVTALQTLQRCYPAEVNAVLDSELQAAQGADAEGAVTALLRDAFGRTTAQPLASYAGVTLASGLGHTNARLREAALKQLGKLVATDTSVAAHLGDVLVRRAADEDAAVAAAALSLPGLIDLCANDTGLHASLTATLASCSDALRAGRGTHAHEKAASRALAVLAQLGERTPAFRDAGARAIVDYLVDDAGVQGLAKAARQASRKVTHAAFGDASEAAGGVDDVLAQQHAALRALGDRLAGTDGAAAWVTSDWSLLTPQGTHTVLLAFVAALSSASQDARPRLASAAWQVVQLLPPVNSPDETPAWASGLPPAAHFAGKDTAASLAAVQQQLWPLVALHIPASTSDAALPDLGNLGRVFARLCRQASQSAMAVLTDRAATVFGSGDTFLALLAAADPNHVDSPAQLAALAQLAGSPSTDVLPLVMVALLHPRRDLREAACAALTAGDAQPRGGKARRGKQGAESEQLKEWVQSHQDTLCTGGATLQLLRGALREDALAAVTPMLLSCLASLQSLYPLTQLALMLNGTDAGVAAAFASVWPHVASRSGSAQDVALARVLVEGISAAAVSNSGARQLLISSFESSSLKPGLHAAALDGVSEELYAACTPTEQRRILVAAISLSRRSSEPACSAAARSVVTRVSFDGAAVAELLVSLFTPDAAEQPTPAKRARRTAAATPASQGGSAVSKLDGKAMDTVEAVLDVLQWRQVEHAEELVDPLFRVLVALLDAPTTEAAPEPGALLDAAGDEPEDGVTPLSAARGYRLTLALSTLAAVVRGASDCRIDVPLIVRAVQLAPDANVRRAALQLLTIAAVAAPTQVIADALRVVQSLTSVASVSVDDAQAARALRDAFVAIAPCCVQANSDNGEQLMRQVIDALPAVPQHRRVPLLSALLQALPAPHALVATLRMVLASEAEAHSLAAVLCSLRPQVECLRAWQAMLLGPEELPAQALVGVADFIAGELTAPRFQSWFQEHVDENDAQSAYADLIAAVLTTLERVKEPIGGALERQSLDRVLAALKALAAEPMQYVLALAQLFGHADRRVQRRALLLASQCMHVGGAEAVVVTAQEATQAATLHTHLLPLVRGDGQAHPASQRGALEVLVALNSRYGNHEQFTEASLAILRAAVHSAAHESRLSVRAAALSCVASSLAALSTRAMPVLPQVIPTVLDVLEATDVNAPDGVKASAAALSVLAELVLKLESFLSPVLGRTQKLLLSSSLCSPAAPPELRQAAGEVRTHIAARVPVRLLLEPLLGSWDAAISVGREACVAMLLQLKQLAERLDSAQTAAYSEAAFAFVLLCLDVRRTRPDALQGDGDIDEVEKAAIGACVALVLKLSEIRFTPLFMTALEWSRASPERAARPLAFFRLACALSDALRSVFVPFYKHLLADAVAYLTSGPTQQQTSSKKARRTADAAEVGADALASWSLRAEVVAALRLCFLHDTSGFVDEARFNMLLPALVQQLDAALPPAADDATVFAADDVLVDSLVQLAVAVGQDSQWRALNRAVLMATRSPVARPRRLGVAVVAALVDRLAEEYLVLLPETMPFLAELVEDADEDIEAGARQLLTKLSQLADEDIGDLLAA